MRKHSAMLLSVLVLTFGSCAEQPEIVISQMDPAAEKAAVENVIGQFIKSMETLDVELFSSIMAHDSDMMSFGTDQAEKWIGWDSMFESVQTQFTTYESMQVTMKEQVVKVHSLGRAAWFAAESDWTVTSGGESVDLLGARMTGVLEKRGESWLIVQIHISVPVAGQAVEY